MLILGPLANHNPGFMRADLRAALIVEDNLGRRSAACSGSSQVQYRHYLDSVSHSTLH